MIKSARIFVGLLAFSLPFFLAGSARAATIIKPELSWQRSTEAQDKIVTETVLGFKVAQALALPLDPNQVVFDNGISTPQINKSKVPPNVFWASWIQYSAPSPFVCGPNFELRHFQAKFNLSFLGDFEKVKLVSPYYPNDYFPINDNAYIYINGNFVTRLGTSYQARHIGFNGNAQYANETDGWVADGNLGSAAQFLKVGQNTLDIAAGETCRWGGMGRLELVLELKSPQSFLDLPWDYQGKGLSFTEAALTINSYFDHEYPLLSSGLGEPQGNQGLVTNYNGERRDDLDYSTHDGYDYGRKAKANIGDSVLASAAGCASYSSSSAGGNIIKIDHRNGYQTRYLHLIDDQFLVTKSASCVDVEKGQRIGSVGYSGNVLPPGEQGAHIHFMVIQDKNNDGNFDDNIPDGITDPFGWQSSQPDPWSNFIFNYAGQDRTGNSSFYLWIKAIANLSSQLVSNGGFFELERYKLNFPQGATNQNLNIQIQAAPNARPSSILESIGSTIIVTAKTLLSLQVNNFQQYFTISINFAGFDLSPYNLETLSIYSSEDGVNWTKEETTIDPITQTASAQLNHLSHFALMAERLDTSAPSTTPILAGDQGQRSWFRSDVQVDLIAQDNEGGLGVEYTLYKLDQGDWQEYVSPIIITEQGHHEVDFYSVDRDENIEDIKSAEFDIDKNPPVVTATADRTPDASGWYTHPVEIIFTGTDNESQIASCSQPLTYAGPDNINASVAGNCIDLAGNIGSASYNFQYDATAPEVIIDANPKIIWPPDNKMVNVIILGNASDSVAVVSTTFEVEDEYNEVEPQITDFGQTIQLLASRKGQDLDGRKYLIMVTVTDHAGNSKEAFVEVLVPHDQGR